MLLAFGGKWVGVTANGSAAGECREQPLVEQAEQRHPADPEARLAEEMAARQLAHARALHDWREAAWRRQRGFDRNQRATSAAVIAHGTTPASASRPG